MESVVVWGAFQGAFSHAAYASRIPCEPGVTSRSHASCVNRGHITQSRIPCEPGVKILLHLDNTVGVSGNHLENSGVDSADAHGVPPDLRIHGINCRLGT